MFGANNYLYQLIGHITYMNFEINYITHPTRVTNEADQLHKQLVY